MKEIDPNRKTMLLLNKADLLTPDVRYDKSSMCVPFCGGLGFRQAVFFPQTIFKQWESVACSIQIFLDSSKVRMP